MKLRCKHCDAKLDVRDDLKGKTKPCPRCKIPLLLEPEPVGTDTLISVDLTDESYGGNRPEKTRQTDEDDEEDIFSSLPQLPPKSNEKKSPPKRDAAADKPVQSGKSSKSQSKKTKKTKEASAETAEKMHRVATGLWLVVAGMLVQNIVLLAGGMLLLIGYMLPALIPAIYAVGLLPLGLQTAGHWMCLSVPDEVRIGRKEFPARVFALLTVIGDFLSLLIFVHGAAAEFAGVPKLEWLDAPGYMMMLTPTFLRFLIALARHIDRNDLAWWGWTIIATPLLLLLSLIVLTILFYVVGIGLQSGAGALSVIMIELIVTMVALALDSLGYVVLTFIMARAVRQFATEMSDAQDVSAENNTASQTKERSSLPKLVVAICAVSAVAVMLFVGLIVWRGQPNIANAPNVADAPDVDPKSPNSTGKAATLAGHYFNSNPMSRAQRLIFDDKGEFYYSGISNILDEILTQAVKQGDQFVFDADSLDKIASGTYEIEGDKIIVRCLVNPHLLPLQDSTIAIVDQHSENQHLEVPGIGQFYKSNFNAPIPYLHEAYQKARQRLAVGGSNTIAEDLHSQSEIGETPSSQPAISDVDTRETISVANMAGLYENSKKPGEIVFFSESGGFCYSDHLEAVEKFITRDEKSLAIKNNSFVAKVGFGGYQVAGNEIAVVMQMVDNKGPLGLSQPSKFAITINGENLTIPGFGTFRKRPDLLDQVMSRDQPLLQRIVIAMLSHNGAFDYFPPPPPPHAVRDNAGKPILSWRVYLLPFLGQADLFKQFRLDEPWDSEHNRTLLPKMPAVYRSIGVAAESSVTGFVIFQDPSLYPMDQAGFVFVKISDGVLNTLLIVEVGPETAVPWTRPEDIEFDPANPLAALAPFLGRICRWSSS